MKTPIWILARLFLIFLVFSLVHVPFAWAQDPFSSDALGAIDPESADNTASTKAGTLSNPVLGNRFDPNERSAVVLSLRAHPPRTASELARAIQLMARIRRWDEVGHWLDEAVKLGLNEENAVQMVQSEGTQAFLQLTSPEANLSELRKANAQKILNLVSAATNNPNKLIGHVVSLRSDNKTVRIQAHRALESAGNRGVSTLINHLLAENSIAPNATMCEAFLLMGKPAFAAWQTAMTSPHADARSRLALLAARSGEPSLSTELCVAAMDQAIDKTVRDELAKVAADRNKSLPSGKAIHRHTIDQMQRSLAAFQKIRWMDEPDAFTTWQLSVDGRSVLEKPARLADLDWTRAAQFANASMLCGVSAESSSGIAVAILLENACVSLPEAASTVTLASAAASLPNAILDSYEFGCLVWDGAENANLASAQLVAVRNLARWANPSTLPNAVRDRLSQACKSGFSSVRYAAAQAMLGAMVPQKDDGSFQLDDVHFDGRNRLERVLAEMRMLEGNPLALVVGGASDLRTHTQTLLESFGYRVLEAASASQTMSFLREAKPIEAVFVVAHVREMNLGELIQRIRSNPATTTCPIAILAASLSRSEHEIAGSDLRLVMGSVPPEQVGLADILRRMRIVTQSPLIDSVDRNTWRELSMSYWTERQSRFVSSQPKGFRTMPVDTPVGQLQLIQLATDNSKPLPQREQASQNFVQSTRQFGVMISSETVKAQYEEYNKRGPDDLDLRIVLGRILDAIEAAKGDRPWAEVAP